LQNNTDTKPKLEFRPGPLINATHTRAHPSGHALTLAHMGGTKGSGKLGRNYKERMFRLISKHRKKVLPGRCEEESGKENEQA